MRKPSTITTNPRIEGIGVKSIGISGVPGTGKTSVAKKLSEYLNIPTVDLSEYAIRNRLIVAYDPTTQSYIVDEEKLRGSVLSLYQSEGSLIIDSHYVEILPREIFEVVIILRRDPEELLNTLLLRGWSPGKVAENVEAELLSICTVNAIDELGEDMVIEVNTSNQAIDIVVREVIDILFGDKPTYYGHTIDWLSMLPSDKIDRILKFIEMNRE